MHGFELFADVTASLMEPEYLLNAKVLPQMNNQASIDQANHRAAVVAAVLTTAILSTLVIAVAF